MFSDNIFKRVLDCIPIPILILDSESNLVYNNKKSTAWLKLSNIKISKGPIGNFLQDILLEEDINKCFEALERLKGAIQDKRNITIKLEFITKYFNKVYRIILTTASNITMDQNSFILITLEDVTYIKERELQLMEFQDTLTNVINSTTDLMYRNVRHMSDNTNHIQKQTETLKQRVSV